MVWDTAGLKSKFPSFSIRSKLLIISVVLLIVPWIGVQYIQDMEGFLRNNQQQNLLSRAQVVAAVLQGNQQLFSSHNKSVSNDSLNQKPAAHLYVRPLKTKIHLDGYLDDWQHYGERKEIYASSQGDLQYSTHIGSHSKYLYMVFQVQDNSVIYRDANHLNLKEIDLKENDHLKLFIKNPQGEARQYLISTVSPGWVNAYEISDQMSVKPEVKIKGEWQQTLKGYNIEIRIPLTLIGESLSFFIVDVDKDNEKIDILGNVNSPELRSSIIIPEPELESLLQRLVKPASRIWLLDRFYQVQAVSGNIKQLQPQLNEYQDDQDITYFKKLVRFFYRLILTQPTTRFHDELSTASYFQHPVIDQALQGDASVDWRNTSGARARILTAAYPIYQQQKVIGVVAVEETSNEILILQNRAMEILINLSVISFLITVFVLLGYATRLSIRIRKLRDDTEQAISRDGRVEKTLQASRAGDEIGDLSRGIVDMLERISEYNRYLETMAGKLSHELRTPVTVIKSSIENIQQTGPAEPSAVYVGRALDGVNRLSDILTRMSEASRLEQTIQTEGKQYIGLRDFLEKCIGAYRQIYSDAIFELQIKENHDYNCRLAPELIVQMLDKVISNAVDFHRSGTPIQIVLGETDQKYHINVINQGEKLPQKMQNNLFESMVSVRHKKGNHPNLGLGLYIARMIVEYHQGEIKARNHPVIDGVEIQIILPAEN